MDLGDWKRKKKSMLPQNPPKHKYATRSVLQQRDGLQLKRQNVDETCAATAGVVPKKQCKPLKTIQSNRMVKHTRKHSFQQFQDGDGGSIFISEETEEIIEHKSIKIRKESIHIILPKHAPFELHQSEDSEDLQSFQVAETNDLLGDEVFEDQLDNQIDERYQDGLHCEDFAQDVIAYLYKLELRYQFPPNFLKKDKDISPHMRGVLIDWITQVHHHLGLLQETLYLTTMLIDRMLLLKKISLTKLQLLGITALFIICKLEERFPPEVKKLIHLTDDSYSYNEVMQMENVVLLTVKFNLIMAEPMVFLNIFMQALDVDQKLFTQIENLSKYLIDLILPQLETTLILPSKLAASALCLSRMLLLKSDDHWDNRFAPYTTYTKENLGPVMMHMLSTLTNVRLSQFSGAQAKFASKSRYQGLSTLPCLSSENINPLLERMRQHFT